MQTRNHSQTSTVHKPLSGSSRASVLLDIFVIVHVCTAAAFASLMLFKPYLFSLLLKHPESFTAVTADSIRWACPFVFGFAGLAGLSLFMLPQARRQIAILFATVFAFAVFVGIFVEQTGRWNAYHPLNLLLFGSLSATYGYFAFIGKKSFFRRPAVSEEEK